MIGESHQTARALKLLKNKDQPHYVFARLSAQDIRDLVERDGRTNAELEQRMHADQAEKKRACHRFRVRIEIKLHGVP